VLGIHDGSDDISTERRTYLIEQVLECPAALLVFIRAYFKLCAVGRQSAGKRRRHAWPEITAYHRGAHEAYLRVLLLEKVYENISMRDGCVREQTLGVEDKEFVHAIRQYLFLNSSLDSCSGNDGMQLHTQFVSQLAAFGEQLLRDFLHLNAFYFYINKNVIHNFVCHYS
jgi:hypothetical protein